MNHWVSCSLTIDVADSYHSCLLPLRPWLEAEARYSSSSVVSLLLPNLPYRPPHPPTVKVTFLKPICVHSTAQTSWEPLHFSLQREHMCFHRQTKLSVIWGPAYPSGLGHTAALSTVLEVGLLSPPPFHPRPLKPYRTACNPLNVRKTLIFCVLAWTVPSTWNALPVIPLPPTSFRPQLKHHLLC